ncbi:hypothetical protein Tco_0699645 [Tanacetum coccineum]
MTNQAILNSDLYKTYYAIATGVEPPKSKKTKWKSDSAISSEETPSKKKPTIAKKDMKELVLNQGFLMYPNMIMKVAESWGDSGEEDDDDDSDGNDDDDDNDEHEEEEEEENVDEFIDKEDDINNANEENKEELDDDQHNVSQESVFEQEEEDAHVTLIIFHDTQKTEGLMKSSSVSSDFTKKLLNFENVSPADNKIASLMDITVRHEEPSNRYIENKQREAIQQAIQSYVAECKKEALADMKEYIDLIDKSQNVTESLEVVVLVKSSSQPKSTYEATASLSEFELTKILMDKIEEHQSYLRADYKRELYDALVNSYNNDKDLFDTYGEVFTLKMRRDDKDKDQDPSARSDRGMKRRKSKEPSHTIDDSGVQQTQEFDTGDNDKQPNDEDISKYNWNKKPEQPLTPYPDWNKRQQVIFKPSQTWISNLARAEKPPTSFDELMDTPIDFSAFVMNWLNITN